MDYSTNKVHEDFRGELNYETLLSSQINRIAASRAMDLMVYQLNVDTLVFMLPNELRSKLLQYRKERDLRPRPDEANREKYDEFWIEVNRTLEQDGNLIFKVRRIPVFG